MRNVSIKQAIISAGGLGTRLRPFTDAAPKPMLPILGKPTLEWHVDQFKKHGVTEFFFTLHYSSGVIMDYFGDGSRWGVKIYYSIEKEPLGTGGGIIKLLDKLDDFFFFIYGDVVSFVDYAKMAGEFLKRPGAIGMQRVKRTEDYADADVAELDAEGKFIKVHGTPHTKKYQNAYRMRGVFILAKKILDYVPTDGPSDLGKEILEKAVEAGEKFYGYECDEYSKGIDTLEKLKEVEEYLKAHPQE